MSFTPRPPLALPVPYLFVLPSHALTLSRSRISPPPWAPPQHLVMILYNMILAELIFFAIFFGYDDANSLRPGRHSLRH